MDTQDDSNVDDTVLLGYEKEGIPDCEETHIADNGNVSHENAENDMNETHKNVKTENGDTNISTDNVDVGEQNETEEDNVSKSQKMQEKTPWMTPEVVEGIEMKRETWRVYLKSKSTEDFDEYVKARNVCTNRVRRAKQAYDARPAAIEMLGSLEENPLMETFGGINDEENEEMDEESFNHYAEQEQEAQNALKKSKKPRGSRAGAREQEKRAQRILMEKSFKEGYLLPQYGDVRRKIPISRIRLLQPSLYKKPKFMTEEEINARREMKPGGKDVIDMSRIIQVEEAAKHVLLGEVSLDDLLPGYLSNLFSQCTHLEFVWNKEKNPEAGSLLIYCASMPDAHKFEHLLKDRELHRTGRVIQLGDPYCHEFDCIGLASTDIGYNIFDEEPFVKSHLFVGDIPNEADSADIFRAFPDYVSMVRPLDEQLSQLGHCILTFESHSTTVLESKRRDVEICGQKVKLYRFDLPHNALVADRPTSLGQLLEERQANQQLKLKQKVEEEFNRQREQERWEGGPNDSFFPQFPPVDIKQNLIREIGKTIARSIGLGDAIDNLDFMQQQRQGGMRPPFGSRFMGPPRFFGPPRFGNFGPRGFGPRFNGPGFDDGSQQNFPDFGPPRFSSHGTGVSMFSRGGQDRKNRKFTENKDDLSVMGEVRSFKMSYDGDIRPLVDENADSGSTENKDVTPGAEDGSANQGESGQTSEMQTMNVENVKDSQFFTNVAAGSAIGGESDDNSQSTDQQAVFKSGDTQSRPVQGSFNKPSAYNRLSGSYNQQKRGSLLADPVQYGRSGQQYSGTAQRYGSGQQYGASGQQYSGGGQQYNAGNKQQYTGTGQQYGAVGQQYSTTGQQSSGQQYGTQQYSTTGQQYSASTQQYSAPAQQYATTGQQYGTTGQQYGTATQQYSATGQQSGTNTQQYGTTGQQYGTTGQYGTTSQYSATAQPYGTTANQYGTAANQYSTTTPQYSTATPQYSTTAQQYGTTAQYSAAAQQYDTTANQYGTTAQQYGTTAQQYGTTAPQYSAAAQQYATTGQQYAATTGQQSTTSDQAYSSSTTTQQATPADNTQYSYTGQSYYSQQPYSATSQATYADPSQSYSGQGSQWGQQQTGTQQSSGDQSQTGYTQYQYGYAQ